MKKIKSLQGLRAIAFLAIFISHTGMGNLGALGAWGVSIFLLLSGFVMVYTYSAKENLPSIGLKFVWEKIGRLYPLHIATMLCCIPIQIIKIGGDKKLFLDIFLQTTLLQIWIPDSKYYVILNGISWYLCVCAFHYLCFPIIMKFMKKHNTKQDAVIGAVVLFCCQVLISCVAFYWGNADKNEIFSMQWITYYCPVSRLIDFAIGGCLAIVYLQISAKIKSKWMYYGSEIATVILILCSWWIYIEGDSFLGSEWVKYTLLYTPTTAILIWLVARGGGILSRILSHDLLVKAGNLTPYTFLIHDVVIKYCRAGMKMAVTGNLYIISAIALVVTFIAAAIWSKMDKVFLNKT